jgi:hypothetical protein
MQCCLYCQCCCWTKRVNKMGVLEAKQEARLPPVPTSLSPSMDVGSGVPTTSLRLKLCLLGLGLGLIYGLKRLRLKKGTRVHWHVPAAISMSAAQQSSSNKRYNTLLDQPQHRKHPYPCECFILYSACYASPQYLVYDVTHP